MSYNIFQRFGDWLEELTDEFGSTNSNSTNNTQLSWVKIAAFVATVMLWAFGAYQGWIWLPAINDWGGLLLFLIAVGGVSGIIGAVLADPKWVRLVGLGAGVIAGIVLAMNWDALAAMFAQFNWGGMVGGLIALAATLTVGVWICRIPRQSRPDVRRAPAPPPTSAASPTSPTTPATWTPSTRWAPASPTSPVATRTSLLAMRTPTSPASPTTN